MMSKKQYPTLLKISTFTRYVINKNSLMLFFCLPYRCDDTLWSIFLLCVNPSNDVEELISATSIEVTKQQIYKRALI